MSESGPHSFGQWLKQRRRSLDITQEQLAEMLGCSPAAIYKIEAGTRRPSRQVAQLLAHNLQVPERDREEFVRFARLGSNTAHFPATRSSEDAVPGNGTEPEPGLPVWINDLIGRDGDIERIIGMLRRPGVRLVTLVGPPGIGKTRLGAAVAHRMLGEFEHGVHFVALAPVSDPRLVIPTIAREVGVQESGEAPIIERLAAFLRDKNLLLVLDNFEQVVEAAPEIARLLGVYQELRVLVTSRQALGVHGEWQYQVPTLALPDSRATTEALAGYPAVALFLKRAQAVNPGFMLTADNSQAIVQLCSRLDGLPLAIELAAARMRILSPAEALKRLQAGLDMLGSGGRDIPARQRTLRGAIAWSYDLLSEEERVLFGRLGCFVGGCSIEAAEAVCNHHGDLTVNILDGLASLSDKSLLERAEAGGESRLWMLEMIREYAIERLSESHEADEIKHLHSEYYLAKAEATDPAVSGLQQKAMLDRLEWQHDNLRAAMNWCLEGAEHSEDRALDALRWGSALIWFWQRRNYITEGRAWQKQILERTEWLTSDAGLVARGWTLVHAGQLAYTLADHQAAGDLLRKALPILEQAHNEPGIAFALAYLGVLAGYYGQQRDREQGRALLERSVSIFRQCGVKWGLGRALGFLSYIPYSEGDYPAAGLYLRESLALFTELGDEWATAWIMLVLGENERCQGNYSRAGALYEQSMRIHTGLGDKFRVAIVQGNLGYVALHNGEVEKAKHCFTESLKLYLELGNTLFACDALAGHAAVALALERPERAARLFGAATSIHEQLNARFEPSEQQEFDRYLSATRSVLGDAHFEAAWQEGRKLSFEQATAYALDEVATA